MGLGTTVVHIFRYPVEVTKRLDYKYAVIGATRLRSRLLVGMATVRFSADAIFVVVMSFAWFLKQRFMITLTAGIFHKDVIAPLLFDDATITIVMREFLEESARVTIKDVARIVNGEFHLTKFSMIRRLHQVTKQTALIMAFPVGRIGGPLMDVRNFLAAVKTFLIVVSESRRVIFVILCPIVVVAIGLFKAVWLFLNECTLVLTTGMDMRVLVF
jgi:hypothetical protein